MNSVMDLLGQLPNLHHEMRRLVDAIGQPRQSPIRLRRNLRVALSPPLRVEMASAMPEAEAWPGRTLNRLRLARSKRQNRQNRPSAID